MFNREGGNHVQRNIHTDNNTVYRGREGRLHEDETQPEQVGRNRTGRNSSARVQRRIRLPVGRREV